MVSRTDKRQKGQADLVVFCQGNSRSERMLLQNILYIESEYFMGTEFFFIQTVLRVVNASFIACSKKVLPELLYVIPKTFDQTCRSGFLRAY